MSRPPAHLSMPTPSVVPWARRTGPLPPPWLSSSLPVAGPMRTLASTGRSLSTACRRATPMVPLAHLSRGLRRDGPGRAKSRGSYDTSQFSKQFSPSCTAPHPYYQRCWTPVAVPPCRPPSPAPAGCRVAVLAPRLEFGDRQTRQAGAPRATCSPGRGKEAPYALCWCTLPAGLIH